MIKLEHLEKVFSNGVKVLSDVNAEISKGEVISVIGPSGTGKSTLLRCINLLDGPTGGKIFIDGAEITAKDYPIKKVHEKINMVFQSFNLFEHLTVIENVMIPQIEVKKIDKQKAYDNGMRLLFSVGMAQKALAYPSNLSGGQKQRVAIARALAMDPEIILFDEPTSALDPSSVDEVKMVIRDIKKLGRTIMIVTHDMEFAKNIATRVFYMDEGVIYEDGTPEQIFDHPQKERTKNFIFRMKTMDINLNGKDEDFQGLMSGISAFGMRTHIDQSLIRKTQLVTEELVCNLIMPTLTEPFQIHLHYEYRSADMDMIIQVDFPGKVFDVFTDNGLSDGANALDPAILAAKLIRHMTASIESSYSETKEIGNRLLIKMK